MFNISKAQSYEYFDNQEYTIPTQSGRKKRNHAFLGDKSFRKDKIGTGSPDKESWVKHYIPLMFNQNWDAKQQGTQSIMLLRGFIIWYKLFKY